MCTRFVHACIRAYAFMCAHLLQCLGPRTAAHTHGLGRTGGAAATPHTAPIRRATFAELARWRRRGPGAQPNQLQTSLHAICQMSLRCMRMCITCITAPHPELIFKVYVLITRMQLKCSVREMADIPSPNGAGKALVQHTCITACYASQKVQRGGQGVMLDQVFCGAHSANDARQI